MHRPSAPLRIFETVLYADDLATAGRFYGDILGLELIQETELFLTYRLAEGVLLIFEPTLSAESGRSVPSHGMQGEGHIAFEATDSELDAWKVFLIQNGIEIEQIQIWPACGRSLYVRDPAGNSVEFAPRTLWDEVDPPVQ